MKEKSTLKEVSNNYLTHTMSSKGITLIALVITIIVLLILAGVSIAMLTGDNGILTQANKAKTETEVKGLKEEIKLMMQKRKIDEEIGQKVALKEDLEKEISGNKVIEEIEGITEAYYVTKENQTLTVYEDGTIAEGRAIWDGVSKTKPEIDSEGNWHIKTPEEFKYFADFVNGKLSEEEKAGLSIGETTIVNLENNIDLGARQENGTKTRGTNWESIGKVNKFSGKFEGNNYTIRGIYIDEVENYTGLFGVANEIKNLTIKDSYIISGSCTGGIVGKGDILENCHNDNTQVILKEGDYRIVGGIVGQVNKKISNCNNSGTIIANGKSVSLGNSECGGIAGRTSKNCNEMQSCNNVGKVKGKGNLIGGIVGDNETIIRDCKNSGEILGENQVVGGIAGKNRRDIEKSENQGKVTGKGMIVGGIAGDTDTGITIKECKNSGEIVGESNFVGGISGATGGNINKCYNTGKVIGNSQIGGIVGGTRTESNSVITNCYNEGEVISKNGSAGGIVAFTSYKDATVTLKNTYNTGKISGKTNVGGIIGYDMPTNLTMENNYYLSGTAEIGAGYSNKDVEGKIERKEEQEMKTEEFGNLLNAGQEPVIWKGNNGEYPELIY